MLGHVAATQKSVNGTLGRVVITLGAIILVLGCGWMFSAYTGAARVATIHADRVQPLHDLQRISQLLNGGLLHPALEGQPPNNIGALLDQVDGIWRIYLATYLTEREAELARQAGFALADVRRTTRLLTELPAATAEDRLAWLLPMTRAVDKVDLILAELLALQVEVSRQELEKARAAVPTALFMAGLGALAALLAIAFSLRALRQRIGAPIAAIARSLGHLAGDAQGRIDDSAAAAAEEELYAHADFAQVAATLSTLRGRLAQRGQLTAQLQQTVGALEEARDELVESGKLASLGRLVAGLAHELNTPIGNALTVASTLADRNQAFEASLSGNAIRRGDLTAFADDVRGATDILTNGLRHAAELVGNFKQVAVDQASLQRRPYDLATVVDQVLSALRPGHRRSGATIMAAIPPGITMDGYPGALGQVLTNLIDNAVMHGLDGLVGRSVTVSAMPPDTKGRVILTVADNGHGMEPEVLSRIFDPFFTTRMGSGGTGLGLAIVRNLVMGVLGGKLRVDSQKGTGTRIIITLPQVAPDRQPSKGEETAHAAR